MSEFQTTVRSAADPDELELLWERALKAPRRRIAPPNTAN